MNLRAPAVPLITNDPYFSIWSMEDQLNADVTRHWTGKQHRLTGILEIDGISYCFMGISEYDKMKQERMSIEAVSTEYIFTAASVEFNVKFVSPLFIDTPVLCSRPITYIMFEIHAVDNQPHQYSIKFIADDELCLDHKGQWNTSFSFGESNNIQWGRVGSEPQNILSKSGDDLRIDWGYFYLAVKEEDGRKVSISQIPSQEHTDTISGRLQLVIDMDPSVSSEATLVAAYDDIKSIEYFKEALDPLWKSAKTPDILSVISEAFEECQGIVDRCKNFSASLYHDAKICGGEKYAQLLALAYRQAVAAHKLVTGPAGELLFISKECFSNGCAATVDVSYPSAPLFLLYNPELVKGMLRPILKYAASSMWPYDFAPHDAGQYPKLNGQVYWGNKLEYQMPVEECGNVLILMAAVCTLQKDISFAVEHWTFLEKWADYLLKTGMDPENQLCTDDFAGHLAHNCNLSIKAIMGLTGFSLLCRMKMEQDRADFYLAEARRMAGKWMEMAAKEDGTFRLAFDQEDSFSMKYNLIWDKLWGTKIFEFAKFQKEFQSYLNRLEQYGMPLDNRADYTKSDWIAWCAALMDRREDFMSMIEPLYAAYHDTPSRIPMSDWYDTKTAKSCGFQNRTVQGGLFIRLLMQKVHGTKED
jgi:hypothetical protein